MRLTITLTVLLWSCSLFSQDAKHLISNSGNLEQSNFNVHATLGQTFINQVNSDYSLSEGFHQFYGHVLQDKGLRDEVLIFPNPTNNLVQINYSENIQTIHVLNELGALVMKLNKLEGLNSILDFSTLPNGIYFVHLDFDDGIKSVEKIIKL